MGQDFAVAAATDIRRVLRALRPLALLGGFVVMWWCLATAAAQADDGPGPDLGTTHRAVAATADGVTHQPTRRVADRVRAHRAAPVKVVKTVRHDASPVLSAPRAIVRSSPAGPVVTGVSDTVRSHLTKVVEQTRTALETTPAGGSGIPELDTSSVGESSTLQGETPLTHAAGNRAEHFTALAGADAVNLFFPASTTASTGLDQAAHGSPPGDRSNTPSLRSSGTSAASSSQSGSGQSAGAALCESGFDTTLATKTSVSSLADSRPAGPAYAPSSSPD